MKFPWSKKEKKKFILVACARNEGPYLLEWICYHKILGFDEIHIYSHDNNDNSDLLLKKLDEIKLIRYFNFTGKIPENRMIQPFIYNQAFKNIKAKKLKGWLCVIDLDEFIVLKDHQTIQAFIQSFPDPIDGVVFHWVMFNASGQLRRKPGGVLERFKTLGIPNEIHPKTIAKISSLRSWKNSHVANYKFFKVNIVRSTDGNLYRKKEKCYTTEKAYINHYFTKSYEEFLVKHYRGGGGDLGKDVSSPQKRKNISYFIRPNSLMDQKLDTAILETDAYKKMEQYQNNLIKKHNLKDVINVVDESSSEFSRGLLETSLDKLSSADVKYIESRLAKPTDWTFMELSLLLAHKRDLIYLHIPKTAGMAIRFAIEDKDKVFIIGHMFPYRRLFDMQCDLSRKFIFTSIRNPWDRLVSIYFYFLRPEAEESPLAKRVRVYDSFNSFVKDIEGNSLLKSIPHLKSQVHYIKGSRPTKLDFIIRFENLVQDVKRLQSLRDDIPLKDLQHKNSSKHGYYTKYYNEETKAIVAKLYKDDIDTFGYTFEGGPSKVINNQLT